MATLTSPSLGKLISNVRNFLSSPNPSNSQWTDAELTEYLNEAVRLYASELIHTNDGQFLTRTTLNIVADTETIALPTDCFVVKCIRKKVANGYVILDYRNDVDSSYSTQGGTSSESFFPSYSFRGNNIVLRPTPNFAETAGIEIEYIQSPDVMVAATDTLTAQVTPIFKNLIEMYAVYKSKLKESLVNGIVMHKVPEDNLNALYASFREALSRRSMSPTYITPFDPEST